MKYYKYAINALGKHFGYLNQIMALYLAVLINDISVGGKE